jgi:hypothetical protein
MVYIEQLELVISLTRHLDKFYDRDADARSSGTGYPCIAQASRRRARNPSSFSAGDVDCMLSITGTSHKDSGNRKLVISITVHRQCLAKIFSVCPLAVPMLGASNLDKFPSRLQAISDC